jgi:lipopolysaccharide heptosyltransferase II
MSESQPIIVRSYNGRPWRERLATACFGALSAVTRRLQAPPAPTADYGRILVVKPCCLGDVLMTTPVLAALRQRYPTARIDYAVARHARPAIAGHPEVTALLDAGPGAGRDFRSLLALWAQMRRGRYDLCLVLDRSPLLTVLPWLAGIGARAGIDSGGRGFALNARVPWDESLHEADLYLCVAGILGCGTSGHHLTFVPDDRATQAAAQTRRRLGLGPRVAAIAPGGGTNPGMDLPEKRWPPASFAALADRLSAAGMTIAVVGGPLDRPACEAMRAAMREPSTDLTGGIPFAERAAFFAGCSLFVGNDSGPMHLAVAVGCPVVALFGPTDVGLYGPYHAPARAVRLNLPCSPCFVHGHFPPCPNQQRCLRSLGVDQVADACRELLAEQGAASGTTIRGAR